MHTAPKEYAIHLPYGSAYADRVRDTTRWGEAILQWRWDQRMTQEQTGEVLGLSYCTVANWERGRAVPAPRKAARYWAILTQYAKDRTKNRRRPQQ